jgi:hypothetical protein
METMTETAALVGRFGTCSAVDRPPIPVKQAVGIIGAVAGVASRDTARGTLAGVHVEYDGDTRGIILTATDSYRLLSVTVPNVADDVFDPFTVAGKDMAAAVKVAAKGKGGLSIVRDGSDSCQVFGFTAGESDSYATVPVIGGEFAHYRRLFDFPADSPAWPGADETVNVNPDFFAGLLSSCAVISGYADRPKNAPLPETRITRMSASKVTMITGSAANGVSFRGLVMPLRK